MYYPLGDTAQNLSASVGTLSLGNLTLSYPIGSGQSVPTQGSIPLALSTDGAIPSSSFSLTYGNPNFGVPPSLVFGGYDPSRIAGPCSRQPLGQFQNVNYNMWFTPARPYLATAISVIDASLGVAQEPSPFNFTHQGGFLNYDPSAWSGKSVVASIDASVPYMYLPKLTCDALAAELDLAFNASVGLYFWPDAQESRGQLSPANTSSYLSFTFAANGSTTFTFDIKISLTLTSP